MSEPAVIFSPGRVLSIVGGIDLVRSGIAFVLSLTDSILVRRKGGFAVILGCITSSTSSASGVVVPSSPA
ncbi:MAG: hypothetical protein ACREDZ_06080 [Kiloniellales bacterium]